MSIRKSDQQLIDNDDDYREYYEICMQELRDMKEAKFYNSVSVFDIFAGSKQMISGYAKNEELIEALKVGDCEKRFPIYFTPLIKRFYVEVSRQKLRKLAAKILGNLFEFNDPAHVVNQKILSYISDVDLKSEMRTSTMI